MTGRKIWMFLPLVLFYFHTNAQTFEWKSKLDTVPGPGFYRIPLSVDWLVHLKTDLSDIRIKDERNKVVPFIIKTDLSQQGSSFINFPVLKNTTDSISTTLEIDANGQNGTDHLYLVIGNHAVERLASLSGSDDRNHWFIIHEKLPLTNRTGVAEDRFVQWLSFPFIRYRYLKLNINNKGTDPLPLLKAGIYTDTSLKESHPLHLHPGTVFRQKDSSDGRTYAWVRNAQPYPVERISMELAGSKFYKRQVTVYNITEEKGKELLTSTEINSNEDAAIWVEGGKTQNLLILIENGDNPPLKINAVHTHSRRQELIAYLEKGKEYTLMGGNQSVSFPDYDLTHFRDSIPLHLMALQHGPLLLNSSQDLSSNANKNWWIWPSVVLMLMVLIMLTYRLVGDMKRTRV